MPERISVAFVGCTHPHIFPRIELLRHKSLVAGHQLGFQPVIHTAALLDLVRDDWRALRPLVEWIAGHTSV